MSPSAPSSRLPSAAPSSSICGADFRVQPLLVKHRREQADRRRRRRFDIAATTSAPRRPLICGLQVPQADDIAVFAQDGGGCPRCATRSTLRASRDLALHFGDQGVADIGIERGGVGMAGRGARHRDAAAGAFMQAERVRGAREFEIDQMKAVGNHEADGARQLLGDILQPQPDQVAKLQPLHHRGAHRHRAWTDAVFLVARQIDELAHPRQRVREPRYRRARQTAAAGNFQIAESAPHVPRSSAGRRTPATPPGSHHPRLRDRWRAFPAC